MDRPGALAAIGGEDAKNQVAVALPRHIDAEKYIGDLLIETRKEKYGLTPADEEAFVAAVRAGMEA